jgi:2-alkyl-3-oxoalkanoate reductase
MKALVTGGGGFLGSHIVKRLIDRGDQVVLLARSEYPALASLGVECVRGDVQDPAACAQAVKGVDSIFHVASKVGYWGPLADYRKTNVDGTRALLDEAKKNGIARFVYTSTPSVVIGDRPITAGGDETLPYPTRFLSPYAASKAEAEQLVLAANDRDRLRTVSLRPHFIFGPGDPQLVPRLVLNAKRGTIAQVGDGSNEVDVTYIDNCVDAHLQAHDALGDPASPAAGRAYFLGNERPIRLWEFVARVLEGFGAPPVKKRLSYRAAYAIGSAIELAYRVLPLRGEPPLTRTAAIVLGTSHWFDHRRAHTDFAYAPKVSIDEGLARLFAHSRS